MPSKLVEDALKRATPEKQQENKEAIKEVNKHVDLKTMKEVEEPSAPPAPQKSGKPDPNGAARTRLNPDFRERIESIQQNSRSQTNDLDIAKEAITPEVLPETPITTLEIFETPSTIVTEIQLIP